MDREALAILERLRRRQAARAADARHRIGSRAASLHNHGSTTFFGSTSAHPSPGNVGSLRGTEGEEEGEGEVPWDEEPPGRASPSAVSPTVAGSDA